jgi:uncharacterized protein YjiS (DUF1127 family)
MSGSIVAFPVRASHARPAAPDLATRFRRLIEAALNEWRLRRDYACLQAMDARGLHDIGLTRGSLEGAVRYGRDWRSSVRDTPSEPIREAADFPTMPLSWTEWR